MENSETAYATATAKRKNRALDYLQLIRFPNIFTAIADILAGYVIIPRHTFDPFQLLWLCVASSSIYAGGCVLNDICDKKIDAIERPFRPLPSGAVSSEAAILLALLLLAAGLVASSFAGKVSLLIACFLTSAAVSYDVFTKSKAVPGPLNMAACRALNFVLGMSAATSLTALSFIFPLITTVYVFSLSTLSRNEVSGSSGRNGWLALGSWVIAAGAVLALRFTGAIGVGSIPYILLLILITGSFLLRAVRSSQPNDTQTAVKTMVLCIPILDAVYSAGVLGWSYGIPVAMLAFPALYISRRLYVT